MTDFEQKAIDHLVERNILNLEWHEYRTSVIDLSDTVENLVIVTVYWEDETGDTHTAIVRCTPQSPGLAHLVMYGLNVA